MQQNFIAEKPLGYAQAAAGTFDTAKTLAVAGITVPDGTALILIVAEAQAIRWRDDGIAPTTTVGQPLAVSTELRYTARGSRALQIISQAAGAIVNFVFYGQAV
jgi:hypothetical protein